MKPYLLNNDFEKTYNICASDYEEDHNLTLEQVTKYIHHLEKRLIVLENAVKDLSVQMATKEDLHLYHYREVFGTV